MPTTKAALPPIDAPALARLFGQRRELLTTWRRLYESSVRAEPRIDAASFDSVFGREIDGLRDPGVSGQPEAVQAALRATALCFARRGIPLSHVLSAAAAAEDAVRQTRGDLRASDESMLASLEKARARVYSRAYLDSDTTLLPSCDRTPVPLRTPRSPKPEIAGLVGCSSAMQQVREAIGVAAEAPTHVLITGESGTGKSLVARSLHEASGREPFVAADAASLSAGLPDARLDERRSVQDVLAAARGGTLYLDELADLHAEAQSALLGLLEAQSAPAGDEQQRIPVRIIASTSRDPEREMASGRLRRELFYRISAFPVRLPPLRERREDIPELVEHFLGTFCHRRCGCIWGVSEPAMRVLTAARWPGNVRQLKNAVEHAVTRGTSALVQIDDLPADLQRSDVVLHPTRGGRERSLPSLAESEAELIRETLRRFDGNKVRTAQSLGISRNKLYDRLRKLGLG